MRVNIWIRKDNEKTWESLGDKSAWVNDKLNEMSFTPAVHEDLDQTKLKIKSGVIIKTVEDLAEHTFGPRTDRGPDYCQHGFNTKVSKCKYGCKR